MTAEELARHLMEAQAQRRLARHREVWQPTATPASALGYRCDRRLVYMRTRPEMASPVGTNLASLFDEGDLHEFDVKRELAELGHELHEGQRAFSDERLDIRGRIDGMIALSPEHRAETVPVEIKRCVGTPPTTPEGLQRDTGLHGRQYCQLITYEILAGRQTGLLLFKDAVSGLWTVVACPLDYDFAEGLLQKAERVRDHVRAGTLPDRLADRRECGGCPFRESICHPADAPVDPLLLVNDAELLGELEEHERIAPIAMRWRQLDERIKARFKLTAGTRFVVGNERGFYVRKRPHGDGVRIHIERL